ncbi:hypothetical protein Bca4012_029943 [Brassica carinata]
MEQSLLTEEVQNLIGPGEEAIYISQPQTTQSVIRDEGFTEECTDQAIAALQESNVVVEFTKEKIDLEAKLQRNTRNLESTRLHHRYTYHIVPPPPLPKAPSDSWLKRTLPTIPPKNRDFEPPCLAPQPPPQLRDGDALKRRPDMDTDKDMSAAVIEGNDAVTGHIISTTIGGKNGEPKQASTSSSVDEEDVYAACGEDGGGVISRCCFRICLREDPKGPAAEGAGVDVPLSDNREHLRHCFFSTTSRDELFLNLVMEYVPETLYRVLKHYTSSNQRMPIFYVKFYTYQVNMRCYITASPLQVLFLYVDPETGFEYVFSQIFRGLAYIHAAPGVCHRDLKPQNLLVDPLTHQCKLCDFGSAKILPLFPGENSVDQLVEIIKVLGTPTREEIRCMNPNYTDFRFPQIKAHPWHKVFHKRMPPETIDLASRLLQYSPSLRCTALSGASLELIDRLIPEHVRRQMSGGFPLQAGH